MDFATGLITSLSSADIDKILDNSKSVDDAKPGGFVWNIYDIERLLFGILSLLCFNEIEARGLAPEDEDYQTIICNLSALSGLFQRVPEGTPRADCLRNPEGQLPPHWIAHCLEKKVLPIDWRSYENLHLKECAPTYMSVSRFKDVLSFMTSLIEDYQPSAQSKPQAWQYDGLKYLAMSAARTTQYYTQSAAWREASEKQGKTVGEQMKRIDQGDSQLLKRKFNI